MSRYYILDVDDDTEFFGGPFSSVAAAKAHIKQMLADAYQSNDKPFCECLDEDGDTSWSTSQWVILQEVERLKATPKVKYEIKLTQA